MDGWQASEGSAVSREEAVGSARDAPRAASGLACRQNAWGMHRVVGADKRVNTSKQASTPNDDDDDDVVTRTHISHSVTPAEKTGCSAKHA